MRLDFDCQLEQRDDALLLAYRVVNREPHVVGIFDRIRSVLPDATLRFSSDTAWVECEPAGTLLVQKRALPVPPGVRIAANIPPECSRLVAGATREDVVRLPLPIAEMQPFKRALLIGPTPGEVIADVPALVSRVTFTLGVFAVGGAVSLSADHPAHPDVWTATPQAVGEQETLSRSFELARPIGVKLYRVAPWP
jgi:hypothetical protein